MIETYFTEQQISISIFSLIIMIIILFIERYIRHRDEKRRFIKSIISEIRENKIISIKIKEWFKKYENETPSLQIYIIPIPRFNTFIFDFLKNMGFIYDMDEKDSLELVDMYRNLKICNDHFDTIHTILYEWVVNTPAHLKILDQVTSELIEQYFDSKTDKLIKYFEDKLDCGGEG